MYCLNDCIRPKLLLYTAIVVCLSLSAWLTGFTCRKKKAVSAAAAADLVFLCRERERKKGKKEGGIEQLS